jgi:hypothetical protein
MITIEKSKYNSDWNDAKFVLRARSKDETRYHLKYVQSTGKRIVATDGHRLHSAKLNTAIPKGVYEVIESKDKIVFTPAPSEIEYPDWMQCWPRKHKSVVKVGIYPSNKEIGNSKIYHTVYRAMPESNSVNHKFLDDLASSGHDFIISIGVGDIPLVFRNNTVKGLIMPMRA